MAFKLNITKAHPWPSVLGRDLDADGAFRYATMLASMRAITPLCFEGEDYFGTCLEGTSITPPDFTLVDPKDKVDAYRVMGGLFEMDGGVSHVDNAQGDVPHYSSVERGKTVFTDVIEREDIQDECDYTTERGAKLGEVNSCFASKFPYRYWWQAFNRAIYNLMGHAPFLDTELHPDGYGNGDDENTSSESHSVRVYPYVLSKTPAGVRVVTFDNLLTEWVSSDEMESYGMFVQQGSPWLLTASDIDFSGVFNSEHIPRRDDLVHTTVRDVWRDYAISVGFRSGSFPKKTTELPEGFKLPRFKDGLDQYWLADSTPKFNEEFNRLAQLNADFTGDVSVWRDEFPYHGFAALSAFLKYLDGVNVGYALTSPYFDEHGGMIYRAVTKSLYYSSDEVPIGLPASESDTIELEVNNMIHANIEGKSETREDTDTKEIYAEISDHRPTVTGIGWIDYGARFILPDLERVSDTELKVDLDHDTGEPGFFGTYIRYALSGNILGFEEWMNDCIFRGSRNGFVRFSATSQTTVTTPTGFLPPGSVENADTTDFTNSVFNVAGGSSPFIPRLDQGLISKYLFLRTSKSSKICHADEHGLLGQLKKEAELPSSGELDPQLLGDEKITASISLRDPPDVVPSLVYVTTTSRYTLRVLNYERGREVVIPLPFIYKVINQVSDSGVGRTLVFPKLNGNGTLSENQPREISGFQSELRVDVNDENDGTYSDRSTYSKLRSVRSIQVIRYPERVIYPK